MEIENRGSLSETGFITILLHVHSAQLTGMIRAEQGSLIKVVYVHKGTVSFASSNEPSDKLTEVLKRAGKITSDLVEDAIARLKPNVSLGKTLVELGYISARDLLWGARAQVEGILQHLLFWKEGAYQIMAGNLPKEIIHLNLSVPNVIFDGILKCQDRQWILDYIGSPEAVYRIHPDFEEQNQVWKLPVQEIAARMNGRRNLLEIAHLSGLDAFDVCKSVVGLEVLGCAKRSPEAIQMTLETSTDETGQQIEDGSATSSPDHLEANQGVSSEMQEVPESDQESADLSLGQVVQIPTVEELLDRPAKETMDSSEADLQEADKTKQSETPQFAAPLGRTAEISETAAPGRREPSREVLIFPEGHPSRWKYYGPIIVILAILGAVSYFYFFPAETKPAGGYADSGDLTRPVTPPRDSVPTSGTADKSPAEETEPAEEAGSQTTETAQTKQALVPTQLVRKGNYTAAAQLWRNELSVHRSRVTIQLMIACEDKSISEAFELLGYSTEAFILPLKFKGRDCYRVLYGVYPSGNDARIAVATLPPKFLAQASPPAVVPVSKVLP